MKPVLILIAFIALPITCWSHEVSTIQDTAVVTKAFYTDLALKSDRLRRLVSRKADKTLAGFIKQENRIKEKLTSADSLKAQSLFEHTSLAEVKAAVAGRSLVYAGALNSPGGSYLDSITTWLSFMKGSNGLLDGSDAVTDKLSTSLKSVERLKDKIAEAEAIKAYIRERKQLLREQLSQYAVFTKDLQKMNKQAYYYAQQLKEYKQAFNDKRKAEQKAMEVIKQIPAFNHFMQQHSQLASLFGTRGTTASAQSLEGMQTRSQVEQMIQQRLGSGPNASAAISQQMAEARSKFDELKSKFPDLDNAAEMPDFKPSEMKTKRLLQRLEFGSNIQLQRSSRFFPTTGDLAGQAAYKFHKNGSAGIGLSYKLGMGTGLNNIHFSSQGMGIRSFIDWKLKGTFFLNGGYEQNYQPDYAGAGEGMVQKWTQSGLVGISKKYKINSKLKGNMMLLFDFLYNQHIPRTDPVKVRLGYNF